MKPKMKMINCFWWILLIAIAFTGFGCGKEKLLAPTESDNEYYYSSSATQEAANYIKNYFLYPERIPAKYSALTGEALERNILEDYSSLEGFVSSLNDPYTRYLPPGNDTLDSLLESSSYGGVGIVLKYQDSKIFVNYVLPDSPAKTGGLKSGDEIIEVDGIKINGQALKEVVNLIKGNEDTSVALQIKRGGSTLNFNLVRKNIQNRSAFGEFMANGLGYIKIIKFGYELAGDFSQVYNTLPASTEGLIIDLRDNGGGELSATLTTASYFVEYGKAVLWYKDRGGKLEKYSASDSIKIKLPTAILINGQSASASEILAAALAEKAGAVLVGQRTYGKGVMQRRHYLSNGGSLYLTVAEFLTPNQKKINGVGITPEVETALTNDDILAGNDTQLTAAVNALQAKQAVSAQMVTSKQIISISAVSVPSELKDLFDWPDRFRLDSLGNN